jgi:DNA-binding response OmpR family regulator
MLIEDDDSMLSLLQTLLQLEGYEVISFNSNGYRDQIMEDLRREVPDLVLLDVHLRHVNGFDLLRDIRADENLRPVKVLMSSGMDFRIECREQGAEGFIMKPYMPDDLIRLMKKTIGV